MPEPVMTEFGKKICDIPGYTDCWVQFKTSGYPRKLRREWDAADMAGAWAIVVRYTLAWNLRDMNNQPVALGSDYAAMDDVEDNMVTWIIRSFTNLWLVELTRPRPNS